MSSWSRLTASRWQPQASNGNCSASSSKYQWYRSNGYWSYEPIKVTRRVADGRLDVAADKPGKISVPVTWGRYRLEIGSVDPAGPETTIGFDSGWYAESSSDTPDLLEIALDKPEYKPGDAMTVAVTARSAGKVTLSVIGDKLITQTTTDVQPGLVKLPLTVGDDWGTGAYVLATLRRPLDAAEKRMPGRAIGVQWFSIDKAAHTIGVALDLPALIRPETTLRVPVKLAGLTPNEEARIVVSAVDVGILNLTNYKAPDPDGYYLGQRKLSAEVRDLYGQLIDGMQGTKGEIRSGGDGGGGELQGSPPVQPPLAFYSGIVTVGSDGTAEVNFDIPAFSGTVRVMAVAWSKDKTGHASGDVVVRDPVVVTATLPRFLLMGDKSTLRLDLDNVEGATGDYKIAVTTDGPLSVEGGDQTLTLDAKKRGAVTLPVSATGVGTGVVALTVTGPEGFTLAREYPLSVRPATQILARRTVKPLEPGQSITISGDVFADLVPGTGKVSLSVTPTAALDVATLLAALDRYPLGCTEQIVSRALPLLYVNELSLDAQLAVDTGVDERIAKAIEIVLARQGSEGAFGLWSPGGDDAWLDSYVTDFLTRARARGFSVSDDQFKLALNRLRNYVSTAPDVVDRRRARTVLCALCAGAEWHGAGGRPPLHRRRQAERSGDADGEGRDRRRARHARRPREVGEGVPGRTWRAAHRSQIRGWPRRLRLAAARCGGRRHFGGRRRRAEADPGQRDEEHRNCPQQGELHLDARRCVARARGSRARQAGHQPHRQ